MKRRVKRGREILAYESESERDNSKELAGKVLDALNRAAVDLDVLSRIVGKRHGIPYATKAIDDLEAHVRAISIALDTIPIITSRRLNVWGSSEVIEASKGRRVRVIVAAYSKAQAIRLVCKSKNYPLSSCQFKRYWSETGNASECAIASRPGVWYCENSTGDDPVYMEA